MCLFVRLFSGKTKRAQMTGWLDYCKEFSQVAHYYSSTLLFLINKLFVFRTGKRHSADKATITEMKAMAHQQDKLLHDDCQ